MLVLNGNSSPVVFFPRNVPLVPESFESRERHTTYFQSQQEDDRRQDNGDRMTTRLVLSFV